MTNSPSVGNGRFKDFEKVLRQKHLKVTSQRLKVLEKMAERDSATSQPELEKILGHDIDRVTLYRVLSVLDDKGIIHKILDLNGTATYAFCSTKCSEHQHLDEHVHFTCSNCNSVYCLDKVPLPDITPPANFLINHTSINAVGICDKCR